MKNYSALDCCDALNVATVYAIVHKGSGRAYIGAATQTLTARWEAHVNLLQIGAHHCKRLQQAFDNSIDGINAFDLDVLEYPHVHAKTARENYHIDNWESGTYNRPLRFGMELHRK